jgi:hypothetical protein
MALVLVLCCAVPCRAVLCCAVLCCAVLCCTLHWLVDSTPCPGQGLLSGSMGGL